MEEAGTTSQKTTSTGSDRALVLCPHRAWELEQTRKLLLYRPPDAPELYGERLEPCKVKGCHDNVYKTTFVHHVIEGEHRLSLRRALQVAAFPAEPDGMPQHKICTHLDPERMKLMLDLCNVKICSHVSLSDERVVKAYNPNCTFHARKQAYDHLCHCRQADVPQSGGNYHYGICPDCAIHGTVTRFGFQSSEFRDHARGYILVALIWEVDLGTIRECDPGWYLHTLPAEEVPSSFDAFQAFYDQLMESMRRHLWYPMIRQRSEPWWEDAEELRCLYDLERVWHEDHPMPLVEKSFFWEAWSRHRRDAMLGPSVASESNHEMANDESSGKDRTASVRGETELQHRAPEAQNQLQINNSRPSHLRERLRRLLLHGKKNEAGEKRS